MSKIFIADKTTLDQTKALVEGLGSLAASSNQILDETKTLLEGLTGGGVAPDNMRSFYVLPGNGKVKIKFLEPKDTIIEAQLICTWKGVRIVMKEGGYPENENDGTVILECLQAGEYKDEAFECDGLQNDVTYYFQAFPYSDQYIYNRHPVNRYEATPKEHILYGFKIDKNDANPATRVSYTEMAAGRTPGAVNLSSGLFNYGDWQDEWFIRENKPYMVKYDGTIDYELDTNDYTKKADGTASDVSNINYGGNAMAKIPLVWLKQWEDDNYEYGNICNIQLDDSYKADAHTRADGSVMDYKMLSCFEGGLSSNKIRSIKGITPCNTQTGTNEITYAKANGSLWYTRSFSERNLINMLLLLISRSDNSQTAYGYGYYTGGTASLPNYLPTGYRSDKGQFYGTNATRDAVKVFHIENWWGDVWERIAGCIYDTAEKFKIKMTPPYNTDGSGYTVTDISITGTSGGYTSKSSISEYGRLPKEVSGSDSTYLCDGTWFNKTQSNYALAGGNSYDGFLDGASCLNVNNLVSNAHWNIGVALSYQKAVCP